MTSNRKFVVKICLSVGILLFMVANSTLSQQSPQVVFGDSPPIYQYDNRAGREHRPLYVPGQLIVKFKKDVPMNMRGQALAANQMALVKSLLLPDYALVEFDPAEDVRLMAASLLDDPSIESAEPNYYRYADFTPNDPLYPYQWHFPIIQMPSAWDKSSGAGVTVAVIDTGIAYEDYGPYAQAPDLAGTTFVAGWDFANGDSHPNDDNTHGTHVTGTIAQTTNNSIGLAGIAYSANIMPVKVLDSGGSGTDQWVADGIVWAVNNGAQVLNLSLGGPAPSSVLENAVNYAYNNGATVVAASGNDNSDIGYPAAYENCIAVGAVRYDESRSYYSNYGPALDLVAPGGDVYVDQNGDGYGDGVLQQTFDPNTQDYTDFGYWFFQGTSMAAPHVSGVAALLIAYGNATTPDEVQAALENTAKDKGPVGWDVEYGHGLIQANDALNYGGAPTVTVSPTPTSTPTLTGTPSATPTATNTPTATPTATSTPTATPTATPSTVTVTPTATPTATPSGGSTPVVWIDPPEQTAQLSGGNFTADVAIADVVNLGSFQFALAFSPSIVHVEGVELGDFLGNTGRGTIPVGPQINNEAGTVSFGAASFGEQAGPDGSGVLATISFSPQTEGESNLHLQDVQVTDTVPDPISVDLQDGSVTVQECISGDLDCDCDVDVVDIMLVASRWNNSVGDDNYDPAYDLDDDGDIDVVDIMLVAAQWGETCES